MCDTFSVIRDKKIIFAKNSDREAGEVQILDWQKGKKYSYGEKVNTTYLQIPQVRQTYSVLLSRPTWMWGAEMGTNECGVTIGNEAIFTRSKPQKNALTGMDLVRLALERSASAKEAASLIAQLIEEYGQGGVCGYRNKWMTYNNMFLIADTAQVLLLEAPGNGLIEVTPVNDQIAISNKLYTKRLNRKYSQRIKNYFAQADFRQKFSSQKLKNVGCVEDAFSVLRSHHKRGIWESLNPMTKHMKGLCLHGQTPITATMTTASWVTEIDPDQGIRHWVTASSTPCISLFFPVSVNRALQYGREIFDSSYYLEHERWQKMAQSDLPLAHSIVRPQQVALEKSWTAKSFDSQGALDQAIRTKKMWMDIFKEAKIQKKPIRNIHQKRSKAGSGIVLLCLILCALGQKLGFSPFGEALASSDQGAMRYDCPKSMPVERDGLCYYNFAYLRYAEDRGGLKQRMKPLIDGIPANKIELGRQLFFDPILSRSQTQACVSCHHPEHGYGDPARIVRSESLNGVAIAINSETREGDKVRTAPSLVNVAFKNPLMWDGRAKNLESQARLPLFSKMEMNMTEGLLLRRLRSFSAYNKLFSEVFNTQEIEITHVLQSLGAFQRSLVSLNSRYDQYAHGNDDALSEKEKSGMQLFFSFVSRCSECHTPPLFTNHQSAVLGVPDRDGYARDLGIGKVVNIAGLNGAFVVPSLRNLQLTGPYMHNGVFQKVSDVIEFYDQGGGRGSMGIEPAPIHWHIRPIGMSAEEKQNLGAFLFALKDVSLLPVSPCNVPSKLNIDLSSGVCE